MGQQQLLLIILGVIIVGVAIAVGIAMFSGQSVSANRDAIENDLMNIGADAYAFKLRPVMMGGGAGTYATYTIDPAGAWGTGNPNATYVLSRAGPAKIVITGTSKQVAGGTVMVQFNGNGKLAEGPIASF